MQTCKVAKSMLSVDLKVSVRIVLETELENDKNSQERERYHYFLFVSDLPSLPPSLIVLKRSGA